MKNVTELRDDLLRQYELLHDGKGNDKTMRTMIITAFTIMRAVVVQMDYHKMRSMEQIVMNDGEAATYERYMDKQIDKDDDEGVTKGKLMKDIMRLMNYIDYSRKEYAAMRQAGGPRISFMEEDAGK